MRALRLAAVAALLTAAEPALAHHVMDRQMPDSFAAGLLSGLGHPIIGLDHLAFVVTVGVLTAAVSRGWLVAAAFAAAEIAGAALHAAGVGLPLAEIAIALSVVAGGAAILLGLQGRASSPMTTALAALAGLFHGHALAESIIGAEQTPLVAYFLGLAAIQTAIVLVVRAAARYCATAAMPWSRAPRWVGAAVVVIGVAFLGVALTA